MNVKLALFIISIVPILWATDAQAKRRVTAPFFANSSTIIYITLYNPSKVSQKVDVNLFSRGSYTLKMTNHTGMLGTKCVSLTNCTNTVKDIPPDGSMIMTVEVDSKIAYKSTDPKSGVNAEITVDQDDGYLQASGFANISGNEISIPINGGRPF